MNLNKIDAGLERRTLLVTSNPQRTSRGGHNEDAEARATPPSVHNPRPGTRVATESPNIDALVFLVAPEVLIPIHALVEGIVTRSAFP